MKPKSRVKKSAESREVSRSRQRFFGTVPGPESVRVPPGDVRCPLRTSFEQTGNPLVTGKPVTTFLVSPVLDSRGGVPFRPLLWVPARPPDRPDPDSTRPRPPTLGPLRPDQGLAARGARYACRRPRAVSGKDAASVK